MEDELIQAILALDVDRQVEAFRRKSVSVPSWDELKQEYLPENHPVMNKALYPDITHKDGSLTKVTRITYDLQRLAVRRMTELCYGIPVSRNYSPANAKEEEVAKVLESIFQRTRTNTIDLERGNMLFAGCEVCTLWYAVEQPNRAYGIDSPIKIRCRNYSPMNGDELYPLFDDDGDMVAMSIGYKRKRYNRDNSEEVSYLDVYTAEKHILYSNSNTGWVKELEEDISNIGKIPAVYVSRPTPIWEDTSNIVYELEWANSRHGNYIRANSKPIFAVFADETIPFGQEKSELQEFKGVFKYPKGSDAKYITWPAAVDSLKYFNTELRQMFFTQLQLPDWSYENMKTNRMSGEAMKQMFIDAHLKVMDEKGRLLEAHDREVNILRAYLKIIMGEAYADAIDSLQVNCDITPYFINDETQTITNFVNATGGKPIMSQRQAISLLGKSADVDKTLQEIQEETQNEYLEAAM